MRRVAPLKSCLIAMSAGFPMGTKMKHVAIFGLAALVVLATASCVKSPEPYAVRGDVSMRLQPREGECGYCKEVDYSPDGKTTVRVRIGTIIVRPSDIEYVERTRTDPVTVHFFFKQSAAGRLHALTEDHVGGLLATMSGDRVVSVSQISGPFSENSMLSGLEPGQADYIMSMVTAGPYRGP